MTLTAPSFVDLDLSDPDEQMKVTNTGKSPVEWTGNRRLYLINPGKSEFIPFHVIVRYLGDPRSEYRKQETYKTPDGKLGVIPEKRGELIRLSILYGLYHGRIPELPKTAPRVTVTTLNDVEIHFPIFNPQSPRYQYQTTDSRNIDVRTELERLQSQISQMEARQSALIDNALADDPDGGEAPEDTPPGL
jgi:hypothetical protein